MYLKVISVDKANFDVDKNLDYGCKEIKSSQYKV